MGLALRQWIPEFFIEMQNLVQLNTIKNEHTYKENNYNNINNSNNVD